MIDTQPKRHIFWPLLLGITLVSLAMRLFWLDRPSFWIDELYSVMHTARLGDGNLSKQLGFVPLWMTLTLADALPAADQARQPDTWAAIGVTHWLVRLPSVLIGAASVVLLGWVARGVVGSRAALWFAVFLAVSVWHLHMSQTGRFYVQQMLFYNLALLLYFRATTIGSVWRLVLAMGMLFLAFMSQPPALMLGAVLGIDWFAGLRTKTPTRLTRSAFIAGATAAAACAAVLVIDITSRSDEWAQFAGATSQSAKTIVMGFVWTLGPVAALLSFVGWTRLMQRDTRLAMYLAMAAVFPILLMGLLGATGQFVHVRYTFVALPAWLLLAAASLGGDRGSQPGAAAWLQHAAPGLLVVVAGLIQCFGYYTGGGGYRPSWRESIEYIAEHRLPGDLIVGDEHAAWHARYYLRESEPEAVTTAELWPLLEKTGRRVWVIDKGGAKGNMHWPALEGRADLRWYFDKHIVQPYSTIKIFLYDPASASKTY